jgi:two-component system, NtrC family, sensor histidine kinase HydH
VRGGPLKPTRRLEGREMKRSTMNAVMKGSGLIAAIALITGLHYFTDPARVLWHELFNYLCFIPIIVAAYWFGPWGGVTAALLTSAAFIPHIRMAWASNVPYAMSRYAQILVFHVTGLLVGLLVSFQRQLTDRYRDAASELEVRNQDLVDSQQQLRKAERLSALGEIAAGFVHEVRNPLAAMRGALDIVASRTSKNTPEAEFTEIARKELVRLDSLIGDFLSYARPREPERRLTSLSAVLERVTVLLRPQAERAEVSVETRSLEQLPSLMIDPDQIAQVFINIALNGIQASRPGGTLRIEGSTTPTTVVIDVVDQGPGIPAEHLGRLFEPFFTTKAHGTGLGLALSQRIVAAHHGTIELHAGTPSGTIVRVTLPISPTGSAA